MTDYDTPEENDSGTNGVSLEDKQRFENDSCDACDSEPFALFEDDTLLCKQHFEAAVQQ